ncbi:MAG: O-antigen polysaccharide polymerase Wzy [Bacillota bacterium]
MKKEILKSYTILTFNIIVSGILLIYANSLEQYIFSILLLSFGATVSVKFNISHPYVWYTAFFTVYALGYPLLILLDANNPNYMYGYSKDLFILHWIALVTFLVIVTPKKVDIKKNREKFKTVNFFYGKQIFWVFTFLSILFTLFMQAQGFTSKDQLASSNSTLVDFGMRFLLVYILVAAVQIVKDVIEGKKNAFYTHTLVTFSVLVLVMLATAERDLLLRYILVVFFIYYVFLYTKKHSLKLTAIVTLLFLAIPFSRSIKFIGLRGEKTTLEDNIIVEFINSEFHTQARNVQLILNNGEYEGVLQGKAFIYALSKLFNVGEYSGLKWFQETFYMNNRTGMGFSLVGEGYVNLGGIGVILMFVIIGVVIKYAYAYSTKSIYFFIGYLMVIPIAIYSIRADLNNFLSQYSKQVILILLILKLTDEFILKRKRKKIYNQKKNDNEKVNIFDVDY